MKKENIRILFNTNKDGLINEFRIEEFIKGESWPSHLYDTFDKDVGNCMEDWSKWTIADIFFKFYVLYGFENTKIGDRFYNWIKNVEGFEFEFIEQRSWRYSK